MPNASAVGGAAASAQDQRRRREDIEDDEEPAARRERFSSESVGFWASAGATAWATVSEFMPTPVKAAAGTVLAAAAAIGAGKAGLKKRREDRDGEDRSTR
jgi:hypothetical protein